MRILLLILTLTTVGVPTALNAQEGDQGEWVVIGNGVGFEALSPDQVTSIFRGERAIWPSGRNVIVVMPSRDSELWPSFARTFGRSGPIAFERYWLAQVFQGRSNPPVKLPSVQATLDFVRNTPGAISAVPVGTDTDGLRIVVSR